MNRTNFSPVIRHPLNVRPSGNSILITSSEVVERLEDQWNKNLGKLSVFNDEILLNIISYIRKPEDLHNFSKASRVLYAFTYLDDLWKSIYLESYTIKKLLQHHDIPTINWKGSWRKTVLNLKCEALPQCSDDLICSDLLFRPFQCSQINFKQIFKKIVQNETINYNAGQNLSLLDAYKPIRRIPNHMFVSSKTDKNYGVTLEELVDTPFIITNKAEEDSLHWPEWTVATLLDRFSNIVFTQECVSWSLASYSRYLTNNHDESPLYLFDCNSAAIQELCKEYTVPTIFQDDLFKIFNERALKLTQHADEIIESELVNCRPNFRWLIVGSERTGSTFHKDPNSTSAWNVVLSGCKLWVMLPPDITPPGVQTNQSESEVTSPVSLAEYILSGFFNDILNVYREQAFIGVTFPGECCFVPNGWWHLVINLEDTVAITQNFTPLCTLEKVLTFFKEKPEQISGLNFKKINHSFKILLRRMENSDSEDLGFLKRKQKIQLYVSQNSEIEKKNKRNLELGIDDDIDTEALDVYVPILEMFEQLLIENGYNDILQTVLNKIESKNKANRKENSADPEKQSWSALVNRESKAETFSFGFDFDEGDEDNNEDNNEER